MQIKPLLTIHFPLNPKDNGGEQLIITTDFFSNGDPVTATSGIFLNQQLTLQSYCNSASFNLCGAIFTPQKLRELADLIEKERFTLATIINAKIKP